jgi:hypothetical protein
VSLVKHNNNSISAVTSMASLTTGALTLISEQTASSSASVSFTTGIDSTYPIYKFEFINIHPASDSNFTFQGSTNTGSSYGVTMTTTAFSAYHYETYTGAGSEGVGYDGGAEDLAQSTDFQRLYQISNSNDASLSGELFLFNPSSTTFVKHFLATTNRNNDADGTGSQFARVGYNGGYFNTTSAVDAMQFKMSSGNIDAGTIKLYGIKDS